MATTALVIAALRHRECSLKQLVKTTKRSEIGVRIALMGLKESGLVVSHSAKGLNKKGRKGRYPHLYSLKEDQQ